MQRGADGLPAEPPAEALLDPVHQTAQRPAWGARSSSGAAACWASPITPPSAASISGQRGRRCAGTRWGCCCCRREPTASRSGDGARSAAPRPSRWSPNSSRTAPGTLPGPPMRRTHRQPTKLIRPLAPPVIINSQHHSGYCYTDTNCLTHRPDVADQRRSFKAITPQT